MGIDSDTICYDVNEKSVINIKKLLFESNGISPFGFRKGHETTPFRPAVESITVDIHRVALMVRR